MLVVANKYCSQLPRLQLGLLNVGNGIAILRGPYPHRLEHSGVRSVTETGPLYLTRMLCPVGIVCNGKASGNLHVCVGSLDANQVAKMV